MLSNTNILDIHEHNHKTRIYTCLHRVVSNCVYEHLFILMIDIDNAFYIIILHPHINKSAYTGTVPIQQEHLAYIYPSVYIGIVRNTLTSHPPRETHTLTAKTRQGSRDMAKWTTYLLITKHVYKWCPCAIVSRETSSVLDNNTCLICGLKVG